MIDKQIEISRYDKRAELKLNSNEFNFVSSMPMYLNTPYEYYFQLLRKVSNKNKLLEVISKSGSG